MKRDDTDLGAEFVYKLSLRDDFKKEINDWRKKLPKPPKTKRGVVKWGQNYSETSRLAMDDLMRNYRIPFAYIFNLMNYLTSSSFGKRKQQSHHTSGVAVINEMDTDLGEPIEVLYQNQNESYVSLLILDNATKSSLIKYIKLHWDEIERLLTKKRGFVRVQRTRKTVYKERNARAIELMKTPISELKKLYPNITGTKELMVSKIIKLEGFGDTGDGYLRSVKHK